MERKDHILVHKFFLSLILAKTHGIDGKAQDATLFAKDVIHEWASTIVQKSKKGLPFLQ